MKKTIIIPNIFSEDKGLHIGIILACIKVFISVSEIFSGLAFLDTFLSVAAALAFIMCIAVDRYPVRTLIVYAALLFLSLITSINIGNLGIWLTVLTCLAVRTRNFDKAIQCIFLCEFFWGLASVIISLFLLVAGNDSGFIYIQGVRRFGFGFNHPNTFSIYLFNLVLMWIWLNFEQISTGNILILILIEAAGYIGARTKTAAINMIVIFVFLVWGIRRPKTVDIMTAFAKYITPVCAIFTFVTTFFYASGKQISNYSDNFLTHRIRLGAYILNYFGITWLGQEISDRTVIWDPVWRLDSFTFDNIYTYFISNIGIVWLLAVCVLFYKLAAKRSVKISICIIAWALYGITEVHGINIYLLFPLLLSVLLFNKTNSFHARD